MRSRTSGLVSDRQVQALAEAWLREAMPLQDVGWKCTPLVLRNAWVWLHFTCFATRRHGELKLHLECLRFRRLLNWIAHVITNLLHDGSDYATQLPAG